jgi:hypothetical protein
MRHGLLVLLMAGSAALFSCKARSNNASVASVGDDDNYCTMPMGVPILSVAVDPSITPKDDSGDTPSNSPFMAKAGRGLVLINQINNDLCRDHDHDYVAQLRVAVFTDAFNPGMHAVISPNTDPQFGKNVLRLFSSKDKAPCRDGTAWVNMAKLAKDTSNNPGTMSRFMADAYQFSFLFIGSPERSGGKPTCSAGISAEQLATKQKYFETIARDYLNAAQ